MTLTERWRARSRRLPAALGNVRDTRAIRRYERILTAPDQCELTPAIAREFERLTPSQLDLLYARHVGGSGHVHARPIPRAGRRTGSSWEAATLHLTMWAASSGAAVLYWDQRTATDTDGSP